MILREIVGSEAHPIYQALEIANGSRQYDFLRSMVDISLALQKPFVSFHLIKAFNFQAITCLETNPGQFRPCPVEVGDYLPPAHFRVGALMDDFVNTVNRIWENTDVLVLAAFVLWKLNHIHPFINGNGRTARATSYFVLCVKHGGWLPGATILPELLRRERDRYVKALQKVDASHAAGALDLTELHILICELIDEQMKSATASDDADAKKPAVLPLLPAPK